MSILRTPRLLLRRLCPEDLDALCALEGDEAVVRSTGLRRVQSREETRARLARTIEEGPAQEPLGVWGAVVADGTEQLCGWGMVRHTGLGVPELGTMVARAWWGRGLATELAAALVAHADAVGVGELVARVDVDNIASVRVLEKVGFGLVDRGPEGLRFSWHRPGP